MLHTTINKTPHQTTMDEPITSVDALIQSLEALHTLLITENTLLQESTPLNTQNAQNAQISEAFNEKLQGITQTKQPLLKAISALPIDQINQWTEQSPNKKQRVLSLLETNEQLNFQNGIFIHSYQDSIQQSMGILKRLNGNNEQAPNLTYGYEAGQVALNQQTHSTLHQKL